MGKYSLINTWRVKSSGIRQSKIKSWCIAIWWVKIVEWWVHKVFWSSICFKICHFMFGHNAVLSGRPVCRWQTYTPHCDRQSSIFNLHFCFYFPYFYFFMFRNIMTHDFKAGRSWESPLNCMPSEHIRLHFTCYHFTSTRNFKFRRAYIFDWLYTNYCGPP